MIELSNQKALEQLVSQGIISTKTGEEAIGLIKQDIAHVTPWYIHLFSALGAWISAIIFLLFFALVKSIELESFLAISIVLLVAALTINNMTKSLPTYFSQLLFILSITGHILLIIGVEVIWHNNIVTSIVFIITSLLFLLLYKQDLHKFLSFQALIAGVLVLSYELGVIDMIAPLIIVMISIALTLLWLNESNYLVQPFYHHYSIIKYALVAALLLSTSYLSLKTNLLDSDFWFVTDWSYMVISATLFFMTAYLMINITQRFSIKLASGVTIGLILLALLLSVLFYQTPAIMAALLILIIGIERGSNILVPLAVVALIYNLAHYYYNLDMTLLNKSLLLMISGVVLLLSAVLVIKKGGSSNA